MIVARDRDRVDPAPVAPIKRVTLTLNPLPMIAGRYGANVELVPLPHHALIASAYVQTFPTWTLRMVMPSNVDLADGPKPMVGGELGYRFYSGTNGASGLFVGPSAVVMPIAYPRVRDDLKAEVVSLHAYGAALDVGAQIVTSSGFTFGGGVGVMGLAYSPPESVKPPAGVEAPKFVEPHVFPRLLLAAGYSF